MIQGKNKDFVIKIAKYLLGSLCCIFLVSIAYAHLSGSLSVEAISERLKPAAKVTIEGVDPNAASGNAATIAGAGTPQQIYQNNCQMCHQTGLINAPKMGDKADWAPRIAQGMDTLVKTAWTGIRAMPPKGNCLKCTEEDIAKTVEYMVNASK